MEQVKPERDAKGRIKKGSSGNKSGRPKVVGAIRELAQRYGLETFERVLKLTESENEKVALAACQEVLNRAYGKPEQSHKIEGEGFGKTVIVIRKKGIDG